MSDLNAINTAVDEPNEDDKDIDEVLRELRSPLNPITASHEAYSHDSEPKTFNPDWMKKIPDDVRLEQLSMLGTHDTMALFGLTEHAICQRMTLKDQLESGIRALDIRCKLKDNDFKIYHGSHDQKANFGDVLKVINRFLDENPSETIILRLKQEEDPKDRKSGFDAFFVEKYWSDKSHPFLQEADGSDKLKDTNPKLGAMRKRIVLLDNFSSASITYGISFKSFIIQDEWEMGVITNLYKKWKTVAQHLHIANVKKAGRHINFLSASPTWSFPYFVASGKSNPRTGAPRLATGRTTPIWKSSWLDFPRLACIGPVCSICYEGTNVLAAQRIGARIDHFVGIVYADFPGPALIDNVIALNDKLIDAPIKGLLALQRRLVSIKPEKENKQEWKAIRDAIAAGRNNSESDQFKKLLTILSTTQPKSANKKEWENIRVVCAGILKIITPQNQNEQFKRLVTELSKIEPKADNKTEWQAIRFTCERILAL